MRSFSEFKDSDVGATGVCPAPPPPPPPPVSGQVPALRISTTENSGSRPKPSPLNDPYEPPAAIQNAMLTKDKKPFTYTPGMGGKLDLSQIRSPRMARRVAKNANDEGIEGPPKSALEPKSVPSQAGANIYIQPQVAVPVFPANMPTQPLPNKTVVNNINRAPAPPPEKIIEPTKTVIRIEPRQVPPSSPSSPDSPTSPTQVMLAKAPTPWMKRTKSQEEDLPEWARRPNKSQESSPETVTAPSVYVVQSASPPPPPQRNQQQNIVNHRPQQRQMRPVSAEQNVPVRIEDRPSVFSVKNDPVGHHQFKNSSPQHQQRWGQPNAQQNQMPIQVQAKQRPQVQFRPQDQVQAQPQRQNPPSPRPQSQQGAYIVPMVVEGRAPSPTGTLIVQSSIPSQTRIIPIQPQSPQTSPQRNPMNQAEPGPIQSKSFRVLQKITSTDTPDEVDGDQLRKLQLTEDDRMLMNKFKEQVDSDNYLHQEEEPRFRGAAIPSRAFRYLQNMTDAGEITSNTLPRANNANPKKQNRNSRNFDEVQVNLPPSEQQVAEPKKYQGSAIPSRSFRILQAMTDPQSIATQDYDPADFICQTENSLGNQQSLFFPPFMPNTYYNFEDYFWGYYPLPPYAFPSNYPFNSSYYYYNAYSYYPAGNQYVNHNNKQVTGNYPGDHTTYKESLPKNRGEIKPRKNSTLLFSPKTTDMTTLTDDIKLSTESRTRIESPCSDDTNSDVEDSKTDSSSSDSDSDSYLAYSTGLNPIRNDSDSCRLKNCTSSPSVTTISEDNYEQSLSEKQNSIDYSESDEDPSKKSDQFNDDGITTVSVSLPLRFRVSVSENNQDVTTVIVEDGIIEPTKVTDVSTNLGQNNTVDFTLKRKTRREVVEDQDNLHAEFTIKITNNAKEKESEEANDSTCSLIAHNFETDDEDSGVTSDVSRIISEIDTDSECYPVRKKNTFQRTQTHSRLFKLLTENPTSKNVDRRRNRLSLPADLGSSYDEFCSSNDLSWKRLHEMDGKEEKGDNYYQTWKVPKARKEIETVPSKAHQILNNRKPHWTYRVNVQCPRIRSSKNVPFTLSSTDSSSSPS